MALSAAKTENPARTFRVSLWAVKRLWDSTTFCDLPSVASGALPRTKQVVSHTSGVRIPSHVYRRLAPTETVADDQCFSTRTGSICHLPTTLFEFCTDRIHSTTTSLSTALVQRRFEFFFHHSRHYGHLTTGYQS